MGVELLDKTRRITQLLHNNTSSKVVFDDICMVVGECLVSNCIVISKKGKVLGSAEMESAVLSGGLLSYEVGSFIDDRLNKRLLSILSTKENVNLATLGFEENETENLAAVIIPIVIAGERLGSVFIYRVGKQYSIDDLILCEYATSVVGLEMMRSVSEENAEEGRRTHVVKAAIASLSYTEIEAIRCILEQLDGSEGLLIASKVADKAGITRSVIVNALRKLESAGVVETRSSGMRGTYIRVVNEGLYDEIKSISRK